jgi:hypothetical protein
MRPAARCALPQISGGEAHALLPREAETATDAAGFRDGGAHDGLKVIAASSGEERGGEPAALRSRTAEDHRGGAEGTLCCLSCTVC